MGADAERRRHLAESGIETQRQRREDHVVGMVAEILGDTLGTDDKVPVAEYDALRLPGAPRGVQDGGDVDIDLSTKGDLATSPDTNLRPVMNDEPGGLHRRSANSDDVVEFRA